ncbi:MAG: hypothetical protein L6R36_003512 [Xanthoria steineri]|nr:MAG: hypothetical protein L6R36_003512 [Xanthoria steineri]
MANVTKSVNEQDPVLVKLRKNPLNLTTNAEVDEGNYITALTMGLPYLAYQPQDAIIRHIGNRTISDGVYGLAFAFAQEAILRVPILIDVMWPTDGSTISDTDDVFAAGLANLMTVIQRFVAFTLDGSFASTMDIAANLSDPTGLSLAASTLFTTTGLLQNGFIVVPDPKKVDDPTLLIPAGRKPEGCTRIADGGNDFGRICDSLDGSPAGARYWSAVTNRTYNFQANITSTAGKETLASGKTNAKQALLDIWNEGYADINVMFDGGYQCQSQGNFGALLRVSSDGRMDFNCFSSLPLDVRGASRTPAVSST